MIRAFGHVLCWAGHIRWGRWYPPKFSFSGYLWHFDLGPFVFTKLKEGIRA